MPADAPVADQAALATLAAHRWPGNIRELANVVEHALVLCDELPLAVGHLPARFGGLRPAVEPAAIAAPMVTSAPSTENFRATAPAVESPLPADAPAVSRPRPESLRELEMRAILEGLDRNKGNKARTAEELGISLKTLYNKLHQLNDGTLDKTG
jgi:two-component system NtrC family response regulator